MFWPGPLFRSISPLEWLRVKTTTFPEALEWAAYLLPPSSRVRSGALRHSIWLV